MSAPAFDAYASAFEAAGFVVEVYEEAGDWRRLLERVLAAILARGGRTQPRDPPCCLGACTRLGKLRPLELADSQRIRFSVVGLTNPDLTLPLGLQRHVPRKYCFRPVNALRRCARLMHRNKFRARVQLMGSITPSARSSIGVDSKIGRFAALSPARIRPVENPTWAVR